MTIEERLEALTQTLELLGHLHQEGEHRIARLEQAMTALAEAQVKTEGAFIVNEKRFSQVTRNFETVLDSIKRLENIAASHEQRLDGIESQH